MAQTARIKVPEEFAHCVRSLGGVVLDDQLVAPSFLNADYWFPGARVVAELKCLVDDPSLRPDFLERNTVLYRKWVAAGLVPSGKRTIRIQDLPLQCFVEWLALHKRRFENSTLKKANRQIRETKQYLGAPDATGVLLLVNEGNLFMTPGMVGNMLAHLLVDQYSMINAIVYFSTNEQIETAKTPPAMFWNVMRVGARTPVPAAFLRILHDAWLRRFSILTGMEVVELRGDGDVVAVMNQQFVNRKRQR